MINKLRTVSCFILCVIVLSGVSQILGQTGNSSDKILVTGQQPLRQSDIDKIIEFYEWAFESQFSADERARFQTLSVEAFRQDVAAGYRNVDTLIKALKQVRTKDEPAQQKMREAFNVDFVRDLRASDDEASQLLLAVYERAQSDEIPVSQVSTSSGEAGSQKNLVGKWMRSSGAGGARSHEGVTKYNSGENVTFEFFADGTMQYIYDKQVLSITQCRISESTKLRGTYTVSGGQLTMNLAAGTSVGTSSCEAKGNFKKSLSASTLTKNFVVKKMNSIFRPDGPLILCLDASADDACFERDPKQ